MNEEMQSILLSIGRHGMTPCYVYFFEDIKERIERLAKAFACFTISYAVKSNPNSALLQQLAIRGISVDISSGGELDRAISAGFAPGQISFSGPGKRQFELARVVGLGQKGGQQVEVVCESEREICILDELSGRMGTHMPFLIRINPAAVPSGFAITMGGKASQFGIDEEELDSVLAKLSEWENLTFHGFHMYSASNCLSEQAISDNFSIYIQLFSRFSRKYRLRPAKLIFGAGFGIPYQLDQSPLNVKCLADLINPQICSMKEQEQLADAECVLELGRFLVGPSGYFLTSVISEKHSRGMAVRICDGGMNNHLAACGLMGGIIRRNWPMWKIENQDKNYTEAEYLITGPLCTAIDTLGHKVRLPELHCGDLIAIGSSGAYGLTSSPTRFISHPEPREYLVLGPYDKAEVIDVSETQTASPAELSMASR